MSQTPIHTAGEAARFINHALESAGSSVRVRAVIEGDNLIVKSDTPKVESSLTLPRTPFGYWFAESVVNEAAAYFSDAHPPADGL